MSKNAFALRGFSSDGVEYAPEQILLDMADGQFIDWRDVGLVREATDAEVAKATAATAEDDDAASKPRARKAAADPT